MKEGLTVKQKQTKYGQRLELVGQLSTSTTYLFKDFWNEFSKQKNSNVSFDMSGLQWIDSLGVRTLSKFVASLQSDGIDVFAYGMSEEIEAILECVDVLDTIKLVGSEKEIPPS